jgi:surfactin synthase thioesterase subunit
VYAKLDGKERLFIHDLADRLWTSLQRYEMKAADFFSHSLGHLIKVEMACRILGANVQ